MPDGAGQRDVLLLQELTWVRELARRLLADDSQVDDVVHEAFVAARQQPQELLRTNWRSWLAAVVHNRIRRIIRTERRRTRREQDVARPPVVDGTLDVLERGELHRELMVAVMALEEPYRSAILMRFLDGLSGEQIAERHGVSPAAARKRISRGVQMLRDKLGDGRIGGFAAWRLSWLAHGEAAPIAAPAAVGALWMQVAAAVVVCGLVFTGWQVLRGSSDAVVVPDRAAVAATEGDFESRAQGDGDAAVRSPAASTDGVLVVDSSGRAASGVTVLSLARGALLRRDVSDEAGRVDALPRDADEVVLAVAGAVPRFVPLAEVALVRGQRRLELAAGEQLAGNVVMPDGSSTEMTVRHDRVQEWASRATPEVREALAELGIGTDRVVVPLSESGPFAITGLDPGWSGSLLLGDGWTLRSQRSVERGGAGSSLMLFGPMENLQLVAIPPMFVVGRLVRDGVPLVGLPVRAAWSSSFGAAWATSSSDESGVFRLGIGRAFGTRRSAVRVFVEGDGGGALLEQEFTVEAGQEFVDLGDLVLGPSLAVRVVDEQGEPIGDAMVVVPTLHGAFVGTRTDAAGVAEIAHLPAAARHVSVHARGYRARTLSLAVAALQPIVMAPGNGIDVVVQPLPGDPVAGLSLRFEADRVPFASADLPPDPPRPGQPFRQVVALDADGRAELPDLQQGVTLHLTVLDAFGREVQQRDVVVPAAPRIERVPIVIGQRLHVVRGRVRNEFDRPVPSAGVRFDTDGHQLAVSTDLEGDFVLGAAIEAPIHGRLVVEHPVFATFVDEHASIEPAGDGPRIVLGNSHVVRVHVLQAGGASVPGCRVETTVGGGVGLVAAERGGAYYFDRFPVGGGVIAARLGGRSFPVAVEAEQDVVELRLPALGSLAVTVTADPSRADDAQLQLLLRGRDDPEVAQTYPLPRGALAAGTPIELWLPPGAYVAHLQVVSSPRAVAAEAIGAPVPLRVEAGRVTALHLPGAQ